MKFRTLPAACFTSLLLTSFAIVGCGSHRDSQKPALTPAAGAKAPDAKPPRVVRGQANADQADTPDDSDGVLVVSREIVQACSELQAVKRHAANIDPEEVWLVVLEGLANCMTDGDLKARNVRVVGDDDGREIVKRVLAARGVPLHRVTFVGRSSSQGDSGRDSGRVDITLLPSEGGSETTL